MILNIFKKYQYIIFFLNKLKINKETIFCTSQNGNVVV